MHLTVGGHWMKVVASNPSSEENDATSDELGKWAIAYANAAAAAILG